jgi:two-component system response regulator AtoC
MPIHVGEHSLPLVAGVLDETDQPILLADRSGRMLYANPAACELLGYVRPWTGADRTSVQEMLGTKLDMVLRGLEAGHNGVSVEFHSPGGLWPARVRWLAQSDWLLIHIYPGMAGAEELPEIEKAVPERLDEERSEPRTGEEGARGGEEMGEPFGEKGTICEALGGGLYFLGASPQMKRIQKQILHIASVNVPVLISGESGSGKEVIARMIHKHCESRSGPFVKVNCAALPAELLESELFGHEQGAFTGAVRAKPGKFEQANRGTIFLDEIAEMSTHLQSKLLHILQDGHYSRLGSRHMTHVDVRVIAATNVDVQEAIREGRFREDLYYRLNVVPCHLPPLRERPEEISLLFELFLERYRKEFAREAGAPSGELIAAARSYRWPGNVRELENFVKRYVILGDEEESLRELLQGTMAREAAGETESNGHKPQNLKRLVRGLKDEAEMQAIAEALKQTNWRRKEAARLLGISYKALLYKMRQFGFSPANGNSRHVEVM